MSVERVRPTPRTARLGTAALLALVLLSTTACTAPAPEGQPSTPTSAGVSSGTPRLPIGTVVTEHDGYKAVFGLCTLLDWSALNEIGAPDSPPLWNGFSTWQDGPTTPQDTVDMTCEHDLGPGTATTASPHYDVAFSMTLLGQGDPSRDQFCRTDGTPIPEAAADDGWDGAQVETTPEQGSAGYRLRSGPLCVEVFYQLGAERWNAVKDIDVVLARITLTLARNGRNASLSGG